ncbi:MAG: hypothetical protein ACP5J4_11120 [Anaerolineae bacterium]
MNITELADIAGSLSPFVLALIAILAFYNGWVIPQSVVKSIVADTVEMVYKRTQADCDRIVADIAGRIITSTNQLLEDHERHIVREFDRRATGRGSHL